MNDQNENEKLNADPLKRKWQPGMWPRSLMFILLLAVILIGVRFVSAQTAPVLTIAPTGTNQLSITFTNNIGSLDYDLMWTPNLVNPNFPWSFAAIGAPGETNFILDAPNSPTGFFRAVLDTNAVPLWEAANPANPSSGILQVYIYGPSNGAVLQ